MEGNGGKDTLGYEIFQWDHLTVAREPDMIVMNKNEGKWVHYLDIAAPGDGSSSDKERKKV